MGLKQKISLLLNRSVLFRQFRYRMKIQKKHKEMEEAHIIDKSKKIYYIIRYNDPQSCGWTVYERVVLYGCIYAVDHNMIPVVDMQNYKNIYQEEGDMGNKNTWDKYYKQPFNVTLEQAFQSGNYVLADPTQEWFIYIRMRFPKRITEEFLRERYTKYIQLQPDIINICENRLKAIIPDKSIYGKERMFAVQFRGTDYVKYAHSVQPDIEDTIRLAKEKFQEYNCDYYFVSTEDYNILQKIKCLIPEDKVITYNAGNVKNISDECYVGEWLSKTTGPENASLDYLTTLYILNKCCCIIGGVCGATIVARYRRNPPYEYCNIIDLNQHY